MDEAQKVIKPPEPEYKSIIEGLAEIRVKSQKVFYNPVQEFNRDLSIAVLNVFIHDYRIQKLRELRKKANKEPFPFFVEDDTLTDWIDIAGMREEYNTEVVTILEALSATGLRSIRYAKEVEGVSKIVANDLSQQAVETIRENVEYNGVGHLIETSHDDASMVMYKHKHHSKRFAAIDLDPYGCPSQFLDAAVQSVADGGLLLVTATDMAVLAGNTPETCYSKYGAVSLKTKCCHEVAIRILLQCIESHANRYGRHIAPLLSVSVDFYVRVFVRVHSGAAHCKRTTSKLSMMYRCVGCDTVTLQPLGAFKPHAAPGAPGAPAQERACLPAAPPVALHCEHCNSKHQLGGPIWSAAIHEASFVERVLEYMAGGAGARLGTARRARGVLAMVREELPDAPLYYTLSRMCGAVHVEVVPMLLFRSAILNANYRVSFSHAAKMSVKTDAPAHLLWDIIRAWEKQHPVKPAKKESDPVTKHILSQEIKSEVDFYKRFDANPDSRRDGQMRFQTNPTPFWGPGTRADINVMAERMAKSKLNQNKYTKSKKRFYHGKKRYLSSPGSYRPMKKKNLISYNQPVGNAGEELYPNPNANECNVGITECGIENAESQPDDELKHGGETKPDDELKHGGETKPDDELKHGGETKPDDELKPSVEMNPDDEMKPDEEIKPDDGSISDVKSKPNDGEFKPDNLPLEAEKQ